MKTNLLALIPQNWVADKLNSLPAEIDCDSSLKTFKTRLDVFINYEIYVYDRMPRIEIS